MNKKKKVLLPSRPFGEQQVIWKSSCTMSEVAVFHRHLPTSSGRSCCRRYVHEDMTRKCTLCPDLVNDHKVGHCTCSVSCRSASCLLRKSVRPIFSKECRWAGRPNDDDTTLITLKPWEKLEINLPHLFHIIFSRLFAAHASWRDKPETTTKMWLFWSDSENTLSESNSLSVSYSHFGSLAKWHLQNSMKKGKQGCVCVTAMSSAAWLVDP